MTQPMIDDVLEIIETLEIAAQQLRRLGRGSLKNGSESILLKEVYRFGTKIRTAPCFPRDVCFETANQVEEFAMFLKTQIAPRTLRS